MLFRSRRQLYQGIQALDRTEPQPVPKPGVIANNNVDQENTNQCDGLKHSVDAYDLVHLQGQPPLRVGQAVIRGFAGVTLLDGVRLTL